MAHSVAKTSAAPAKGKAKSGKKKSSGKKKGMSPKYFILMLLTLVLIAMFFPYALVIMIGMAPTAVIFITDPYRDPMAPLTVGSMNICGVVPVLFALWRTDAHMRDAIDQIGQPFNLLMMFGAAAVGWMIWTLVPRIYATVATANAHKRLNVLKKARGIIIEEWGADIVMTSDKI